MSWAEFFFIAKEIIENIPIADLEEPKEVCVNEAGPEAGSKTVIEEEKADSGEDNPVTAASDKNECTVAAGSTDEKEENPQELEDEVNQEKKGSREEIAPAQDFVEEEAIEPEEDSSEEGGLESEEDVDGQAERVTERYKTRKEYLDSLSIYRMAHYMKEEYDRKNLQTSMLCYPSQIIDWLTQEVDSQGREIVDV